MPTIADLIAHILAAAPMQGKGRSDPAAVASVNEWRGKLNVVTHYRGGAARTPPYGGGEFTVDPDTGRVSGVRDGNGASQPEIVRAAVCAAIDEWRKIHDQEPGSQLAADPM